MKYVMLIGNPADGFHVVGPFEDSESAIRYMETERSAGDCWVVDLHAPAASEPEDVPDYLKPLLEDK